MSRRIVSDSGPLITLEKLSDGYLFIRKLYDTILVPPKVLKELSQGQFTSDEAYIEHYDIADLLEVMVPSQKSVLPRIEMLDVGEREAIRLALDQGLPLLIEETVGRDVAHRMGLTISGIAGQILKAFRGDILSEKEARYKLQELLEAGRINTTIYRGLLETIRREA